MNKKQRRIKKYYNAVGRRVSGTYALTLGRALQHNANMEAFAPAYWLCAPIRVERDGKYRIYILEDENRFTLQRENYRRGRAYMPGHDVVVKVRTSPYPGSRHPRWRHTGDVV